MIQIFLVYTLWTQFINGKWYDNLYHYSNKFSHLLVSFFLSYSSFHIFLGPLDSLIFFYSRKIIFNTIKHFTFEGSLPFISSVLSCGATIVPY